MKSSLKLIVSILILAVVFSSTAFSFIPVTGFSSHGTVSIPLIMDTVSTVIEVDLSGEYFYSVVQQPKENAGFVSTEVDKLTQFSLANLYGSLGFLAHNYLAGASFSSLMVGSQITVTYADDHRVLYEVREIRHLQAIKPNNPTTSYLDLDHNNVKLTTRQVFMQIYGKKDRLILQTCIAKDKELSWGRLFIIASPVEKFE